MISRYQHAGVQEVFTDKVRYDMWRRVEMDYLRARNALGDPQVDDTALSLAEIIHPPSVEKILEHEVRMGHDVMGFLSAWTDKMSPLAASQVHYGLTSSDVVDNVLFQQLVLAGQTVWGELQGLADILMAQRHQYHNTVRAGRTHGQKAEVSTWGWRCTVWQEEADLLLDEWHQCVLPQINVIKTPGGVGNMQILGDAVPKLVAEGRRATLVASTQVIPRQRLVAWAAWLVRVVSLCETIAMEVRLSSRSEVGEVMEGAAVNRVGSSAMPHKRNPIGAEQMSGLARVARSHFAAIAETAGALHNERDISNSSVERLVVPDLAELAAYITGRTAFIMNQLVVDEKAMHRGTMFIRSSLTQAALQRIGVPVVVANQITRKWVENGGWAYNEVFAELHKYGIDFLSVTDFLDAVREENDLTASQSWL